MNKMIRQTPTNQLTVSDIVSYGDICKTNYGTVGRVIKVCPTGFSDYSAHTIIYVTPEVWKTQKRFKVCDYHWINELVAVNERILKLYENNKDEVFIEKTPDSAQQLEFFYERHRTAALL